MDGRSLDILQENIEKMKELFPEVFTEKKIDFEKLQSVLGEYTETENERYDFTWNGKKDAIRISQTSTTGTLRPDKENSKNWDSTENLYIEGDNLEVLKLLQKSYHSKVKMIFIDPPYNTGIDFIYKDDYKDNMNNYLEFTNQVDDEGKKISTNSESSGRYHTDWLNMMYPRLRLARNLMTDDGGIFISIDYNEVHNLRKICDEIFGEENFQREIIWRIGWLSGFKTIAPNFIRNHDTILFYSKNSKKLNFNKKYIKNSQFKPLMKRDKQVIEKLTSLGLNYEKQKELMNFINYDNRPKRYPIEDTWNCNEYDDLNSIAIVSFSGEKISKILDIDQDFKGQKSIKMLNRMIESLTNKDDIILDFFAGTSSTAHAVLDTNTNNGENRKFIMVQLPEETDTKSEAFKAGYKTISDIGRERIRRAGEKIKEDNKDKEGIEGLDIGFKSFKLDSSNIKEWNPEYENEEFDFESLVNNFVKDRSEEDILYEIILKYGIDLTTPTEEHSVDGKTIYDIGFGSLYICLDKDIDEKIIEKIVDLNKESGMERARVVFRDTGFKNDEIKLNAKLTLENNGVEEVLSI